MRSTGLFLFFLLGSLVYALYTYSRAKYKTKDATQTAFFIVLYPVLLSIMMDNNPIEAWIAVPVVMAGVPWLFAGIHLSQVVKDSSITDPKDFVGFPIKSWFIGAIASIIIGVVFG